MSTITSVDVNGLTVTRDLSQQRAGAGIVNENMTTVQSSPYLIFFHKTHSVALGTVQIMTGIVIVLLGIVMGFDTCTTFGVFTRIVYWGPLIFIIAGFLKIVAENKLSPCLVKGSLGMNVISAVTAGIAIYLQMLDVYIFGLNGCKQDQNNPFWQYHPGISGVLLVFFLLQFIISICLSAFACKTIIYYDLSAVVALTLNEQSFSDPIPVTIPSVTEGLQDYGNMNVTMSRVVRGQSDTPPTSRTNTLGQNNGHEYEQPKDNYTIAID